MRKSLENIRSAASAPALGIVLMLLAIMSFIALLWILTIAVRVVAG